MEAATAKRNAWLVHIATFCAELSFATPIWLLYATGYLHMSAATAALLFTGMWFVGSLFEIPTGALADKMGRKRAYLLGTALMALFPLTFAVNPPLPLFVALIIIAGFGSSLASGALIPLVHASYEQAGLKKRAYHSFLTTNRAVLFAGRIPSGILGAVLFAWWAPAPFVAWFLAMAVAAIVVWFVRETGVVQQLDTYRAHIGEAMLALFKRRIVVLLMLAYVLANVYAEAIWTAYQVFYQNDGLSIETIGLLFSIIAAISAVSAYFVKHTFVRVRPMVLLLVGAGLMACTGVMLYLPGVVIRVGAIVPMAIASGFMALTVSAAIQGLVPNRLQSTALSIFSFAVYGTYITGSLWIGKVLDMGGTDAARFGILIIAIIGFALIALLTAASWQSKYRLEMAEE